jgi:hypothetical protein
VSRNLSAKEKAVAKGREEQTLPAPPDDLHIIAIPFADEIKPGDSLADKLLQSLRRHKLAFKSGDILVVKHKIVSKAEGRIVDLATIKPSPHSAAWAKRYKLDARVIELALRESRSVIRRKNGVLTTPFCYPPILTVPLANFIVNSKSALRSPSLF